MVTAATGTGVGGAGLATTGFVLEAGAEGMLGADAAVTGFGPWLSNPLQPHVTVSNQVAASALEIRLKIRFMEVGG